MIYVIASWVVAMGIAYVVGLVFLLRNARRGP